MTFYLLQFYFNSTDTFTVVINKVVFCCFLYKTHTIKIKSFSIHWGPILWFSLLILLWGVGLRVEMLKRCTYSLIAFIFSI
jgi:hypothetical protein